MLSYTYTANIVLFQFVILTENRMVLPTVNNIKPTLSLRIRKKKKTLVIAEYKGLDIYVLSPGLYLYRILRCMKQCIKHEMSVFFFL